MQSRRGKNHLNFLILSSLDELISPGDLFYKKFIESRRITLSAFPKMFHRPSTSLFSDFCEHIVEENKLNDVIITNTVTAITFISQGNDEYYKISFASGPPMLVKSVVLSFGGGEPNLPEWAKDIKEDTSVLHSSEIDLQDFDDLAGKSVLIVGSGLSAGFKSLACNLTI